MMLPKQIIYPELASEYECTACLSCINVCSKNAISKVVREDGHTYVSIDKDKCIGCLKCQNLCKNSRESFGNNDLNSSQIFAAWAENKVIRANATSGGIFAAIAEVVLENNGCVIGAEIEGFICKHTVVYKKEELYKLQGSKYMESSMEDVYEILKKELPQRDVLFTGLGCQCAGVIAFLPEIKTSYSLFTIDLVCGGIPSKLLINRFREEYPNVSGIVSFRSKDKYELKVKNESEVEVFTEKSLPLHGFNCGLTNRYNCYNCQFAKAHRQTDITLGDLWNYSILTDEHKRGISMVIVHSDKGMNLIQSSALYYKKIEWENALFHNMRTVCGKQNIYQPRKKLVYNYSHLENGRFKKLYTITMKPKDFDLYCFRVFRYIKEKIIKNKNKKIIVEMIKKAKSDYCKIEDIERL